MSGCSSGYSDEQTYDGDVDEEMRATDAGSASQSVARWSGRQDGKVGAVRKELTP